MLWLRGGKGAKGVFVVEMEKKRSSSRRRLVRFSINSNSNSSAQQKIRQVRCFPDHGCARKVTDQSGAFDFPPSSTAMRAPGGTGNHWSDVKASCK